jgi:hypothetical protein
VLAGVGRASAQRAKQGRVDASPTRYDVADFGGFDDGQVTRPIALARFTGSWKVPAPPKEITAYRSQAVFDEQPVSVPLTPPPSWPPVATVVEGGPPIDVKVDPVVAASIPTQRAVGRAVVAQPEEDDE